MSVDTAYEQSGKLKYETDESVEIRVQAFLDCTIVQISSYGVKGTLVLNPNLPKEALLEYVEIIADAVDSANESSSINKNEKSI